MKLIVTRPEHDVTTRYISAWAGEVITFAQQRGVEVVDLIRNKASRRELEGRIKKLFPKLVFLNGHGSADSVAGHDNEVLIKAEENHDLLEGKIVYALSCDSGKKLGQAVAEKKRAAYIGYADEFIFVADRNFLSKPLEDPNARPFMEASNQVMISILKRHDARESSTRSKNIFESHRRRLLSSQADPDSLQAAQFLWWNMRNQVCLGNVSDKI